MNITLQSARFMMSMWARLLLASAFYIYLESSSCVYPFSFSLNYNLIRFPSMFPMLVGKSTSANRSKWMRDRTIIINMFIASPLPLLRRVCGLHTEIIILYRNAFKRHIYYERMLEKNEADFLISKGGKSYLNS